MIEAQDPIDAVAAHDGYVEGVTRRNAVHGADDRPGDADLRHPERQHRAGNRVETPEFGVDASILRIERAGLIIPPPALEFHI